MINLNMTEEEFLKCTLKKVISLLDYYKKINGIEDKNGENQQMYIDQVLF